MKKTMDQVRDSDACPVVPRVPKAFGFQTTESDLAAGPEGYLQPLDLWELEVLGGGEREGYMLGDNLLDTCLAGLSLPPA